MKLQIIYKSSGKYRKRTIKNVEELNRVVLIDDENIRIVSSVEEKRGGS